MTNSNRHGRFHSRMPVFVIISGIIHILVVFFGISHVTNTNNNTHQTPQPISISFIEKDPQTPDVKQLDDAHKNIKAAKNKHYYRSVGQDVKSSNQAVKNKLAFKVINQQLTDIDNHTSHDKQPDITKNNEITPSAQQRELSTLAQVTADDTIQLAAIPTSYSSAQLKSTMENHENAPDKSADRQLPNKVLSQINDELKKHITYPILARKRGWTGKVTIGFQFTDSGLIHNIHLSKSSGYPMLDQSALDAFHQITHIYFRNALHDDRWEILQLPVEYRLIEG